MLLPSLLTLQHPPSHTLTPEDIYSTTLGTLFPDDCANQHGDANPLTRIVYRPSNGKYAPVELRTADVNGEEQRRKFAHYLWNAGVLLGELVAGREVAGGEWEGDTEEEREEGRWYGGEWWTGIEEERKWSVRGEKVIELGAGVGLGGIMSVLAGAEEVAITDYPAPPILDTITKNVDKNLDASIRHKATIYGHTWANFTSDFAKTHAHQYSRILAADCLWMPHEHENLALSMLHFLSDSPDARVFVIAGFHTGRAKVAPFFEETVPEVGLEVEDIYEMNAEGVRRPWAAERDGGREDIGERKKWLILARLRRRVPS